MTKSNEHPIRYTRPQCRVEQFVSNISSDEQVVYSGRHEYDLMKPTERVLGHLEARGPIAWLALARENAVEDEGCAIHTIALDAHGVDEIEVLTSMIEKLAIARDQLLRLQGLPASDAA